MKKIIALGLACAVLSLAYAFSPFVAVLQIRHAMHAGDTDTLQRLVDWDRVRDSLKGSVRADAIDPSAPAPGLWQRLKTAVRRAVMPRLADNAIERYVTPANAPSMLGYRQTWRETVKPALGLLEPPSALAGTWLADTAIDRFVSFYRRITRAVFLTATRFEIEVRDSRVPGRSYIGTLDLDGFGWRLTRLEIKGVSL